jgi:hypothetical protein
VISCRYARDWIIENEKLVTSGTDALRVGQAMIDLSIFHCVTNSNTFDAKHLYAFRSDNLGSVANLQRRVVAIEDQNIAQTKANKEAQQDALTRAVQLDWRISIAERRLASTESTLRRIIVVQQVCMHCHAELELCGCCDVAFPRTVHACSLPCSSRNWLMSTRTDAFVMSWHAL